MHKTRIVIAAVLALLAFPGAAVASPVHQYTPKHGQHCKANYVARTVTVKHHKHGKIVKRKERVCVYVKPKPKTAPVPATVVAPSSPAPSTPAPAAPVQTPTTPAPHIALRAHLDPTFVQNPEDGLEVTYSYSAEAQRELDTAVFENEPELPNGVLSLYSDGLLVCSMNVGGGTTEGECPVTYSTYGNHTVDTIYSSGETSATTGNETEDVEPFPKTIEGKWEAASANVVVRNHDEGIATVHGDFHGATHVKIVTLPFNSECTAQVVGEEATCEATVEGAPTGVKVEYPGGETTVAQEADDGGTQEVTRTWPADSVEPTTNVEEWVVHVATTPSSGHAFVNPESERGSIEVTPSYLGTDKADENPKGRVSIVCESYTEELEGTVIPGCGAEGKMFGHWQEVPPANGVKAGAIRLVFHKGFTGVYHFALVFHSEDPNYEDTTVFDALTVTVTET
jgi:hypothetical protein